MLGIGQEIAELMSLQRLDEKEAQSRDTIHRRARRQLALFEQIGLVGTKFVWS